MVVVLIVTMMTTFSTTMMTVDVAPMLFSTITPILLSSELVILPTHQVKPLPQQTSATATVSGFKSIVCGEEIRFASQLSLEY